MITYNIIGLLALFVLALVIVADRLYRLVCRYKRHIRILTKHNEKIKKSALRFMIDRIVGLRRPLQGLIGIQDMCSNHPSSLETKDYIDIADFCSRFLIRQLERLQFFAELESGNLHFEKRVFSLRKCVKDAIAIVREQTNSKDISIVEDWAPQVSDSVEGIENAIHRVLVELLDNAIRHGGPGRIGLHVDLSQSDPQHIQFTISDSGNGLSDKYKALLESNRPTEKRSLSFPHTREGMGFLLVKKMADILDARFHIKCEKNRGTKLSFVLPPQALQNVAKSRVRDVAERSSTVKALVIGDDVDRQVLCLMLKKLGLFTDAVGDVQTAIQHCKQNQYDLVFLDLDQFGMAGLEASRTILRNLSAGKNTHVVMLSKLGQPEQDRCYAAGVSIFLTKPVGLEVIRERLKRLGVLHSDSLGASDSPTTMMPSNVVSLEEARKRRNKKQIGTGYHINFNQLFNALSENMNLCRDILVQIQDNLITDLTQLHLATEKKDVVAMLSLLQKTSGELSMIFCHTGAAAIQRMIAAVQSESLESQQDAFENLREIFEGIILEIEQLIEEHRPASQA